MRVVPGRHATPAEKSMLVAEIIVTYAVTRWQMPRGDIRDVAAASRASLAETPHRLPSGTRETGSSPPTLAEPSTERCECFRPIPAAWFNRWCCHACCRPAESRASS